MGREDRVPVYKTEKVPVYKRDRVRMRGECGVGGGVSGQRE